MVAFGETREDMRCPKCKRISTELVSLHDDGSGIKYCRNCKRGIRNGIIRVRDTSQHKISDRDAANYLKEKEII